MRIERRFNIISLLILAGFLSAHVSFYLIPLHIPGISESVLCFAECVILLIIAIGIMHGYVSKSIVRPIRNLYKGSSEIIAGGNFSNTIDIKTGDEGRGHRRTEKGGRVTIRPDGGKCIYQFIKPERKRYLETKYRP
ncbi:MAG: hypothetical protein HY754_07590 [Nitrospirae bacterium]|nr:hypothetical protein [Nitrospirota bacterium]